MDKQITIVGCGPGDIELLTIKGEKAIKKADLLVGSRRLMDDYEEIIDPSAKKLILEKNYQQILNEVSQLSKDNIKIVFLVSGDPLFYSYGESILEKFGKEKCDIIPGISSVQYAFSRIKESWKEYSLFSFHGKKDIDIKKIFEENNKFAILLDPENNIGRLKEKLTGIDISEYKFYIASNLSLSNEKILKITIEEFDTVEVESLSILIASRIY